MVATTFDPKGKTFKQRLKTFIDDAKSTHSVTIGQDNGRTKEWSQKHHVAHMFLYNKYTYSKPLKRDAGKKTISWAHFSDPKIVWGTVKSTDFLRTAKNVAPIKEGLKWKKGFEPDEAATIKNVKTIQTNGKIGSLGTAMVAPGLNPCGQPCKCGATISKHLSGVAADLNTSHLNTLTTKLKAIKVTTEVKALTLDEYLKTFGLHRPLLNHAKSKEPWHVEAL